MRKIITFLVMSLLVFLHVKAQENWEVVKVFDFESNSNDDIVYNLYVDSVGMIEDELIFCFQSYSTLIVDQSIEYNYRLFKTDSKGNLIEERDNFYSYFTVLKGDTLISGSNGIINKASGDTILYLPGNVFYSTFITASSSGIFYYLDHNKRSPVPSVNNINTGKTIYETWNLRGLCCSRGLVYIIESGTGETAKLTYLDEDGSNMNQISIPVKNLVGIAEHNGSLYVYSQTDKAVYRLDPLEGTTVDSYWTGAEQTVYYNLLGKRTDAPSCLTIVVTRNSDGTIRSEKKLLLIGSE